LPEPFLLALALVQVQVQVLELARH